MLVALAWLADVASACLAAWLAGWLAGRSWLALSGPG